MTAPRTTGDHAESQRSAFFSVDHNGFAATTPGMQRSRLSRRIGLPEKRLGVRLVPR
jgi:hypothetical protein